MEFTHSDRQVLSLQLIAVGSDMVSRFSGQIFIPVSDEIYNHIFGNQLARRLYLSHRLHT